MYLEFILEVLFLLQLHSSMAAILQAIQSQQQQMELLKHNMSVQQENYLEVK